MLVEARKIKSDPNIYVEMIDDWIENDRESRYALAPDEVSVAPIRAPTRKRPRPPSSSSASTCTAPATTTAAIPHWREAHRLYPDNWTYKRQAWNFEDPLRQGPTDVYDSSWFEDLKKIGAENYYPEIVP